VFVDRPSAAAERFFWSRRGQFLEDFAILIQLGAILAIVATILKNCGDRARMFSMPMIVGS